jgi:hypothetical protein
MRVVGEQDRALRFGIPAACRNVDHGSAIRILRSVADRRTHSMKKPQVSLPDLIRQSISLPGLMDTRVILREDALRAFACV